MVEYLKTKKGYFYKLKKNGEKKRISQEEYNKKNKTRKNKKIIGGGLADLYSLDTSIKTIILMGEQHAKKEEIVEYFNIIQKQRAIIDAAIGKFGDDKTYFYSEAPEDCRDKCLGTNNLSSSSVAQYAERLPIPIKLSSVCLSDRNAKGQCDDEYANDILSIFDDNVNINCIIVAIGLMHVPELKTILEGLIVDRQLDIQIIIINTVSEEYINSSKEDIDKLFPSVRPLLEIEPPYKLDFIVDVLSNEYGEKIYRCPRCENLSGTAAPRNPADTSLFQHNHRCINKGRIPIERR